MDQGPIIDQPPPVPNGKRPVWELVVEDMQERDRVGRQRYGTPLQPHNGRDALVDAYQEALDLAVYLRQRIQEERLTPTIVCLCGSTRFYEEFQKANYEETMAGRIVLSVGFYPHSKATHGHGEGVGHDSAEKVALDALHFRKVELADEVLILDAPWWRCKTCKVFAPTEERPRIRCSCLPEFNRGEWSPYIGESTRRELEHAIRLGKKIRYLSQEAPQG